MKQGNRMERTEWIPERVLPERRGVYEVRLGPDAPTCRREFVPGRGWHFLDGAPSIFRRSGDQVGSWRGLTRAAHLRAKGKR